MTVQELAKDWRRCGVRPGDLLLLHSSLKRTLIRYRREGVSLSPEEVLNSFLEAVGEEGTVILPLFNFDFPKGVPFDIRNTPSQMGALTEIARLRKDAVRTGHPIYSFAVLGARAEQFRGLDNFSGYGSDSVFAVLRELDGRIASLNLTDHNSMTFYHHIEEMNEVDYRFHKKFTGDYTDWEGNTTNKTYGLFVRDEDRGVQTHVNPTGELMWESGLYDGDLPDEGCGLRTVEAAKMFDFVTDIIRSGKAEGLLYRIEERADD